MSRHPFALFVFAALAAPLARCHRGAPADAGPPHADCEAHVWARASTPGGAVSVRGSWSSWALVPLEARDDGWQHFHARLPPGEYAYLLVEDGAERLDPRATLTSFVGDREVSALVVDDCAVPTLAITESTAEGNDVSVRGAFVASGDGTPLDPSSIAATSDDGAPVAVPHADAATGAFELKASHGVAGKHTLTITARDAHGIAAPSARAVTWTNARARSWDDAVLYQVVVDRFRGDGGTPLAPPKTPGSRAGGTLDGVRAELEKGTFDALGVTALWLSPVYENPSEARLGRDGHAYEGYHGYWPLHPRTVDPRLGGETALRALIDAAHLRGLRVLLDLVPNHVYEASERYLAHRQDGWFHDGPDACVCGDPGCDWGGHLASCWFTSYLPDVRYESEAATKAIVDDAVWWTTTFDADGVRIDAVPMMARSTTRRIAAALRASAGPPRASFVLGEVFTGAGVGAVDGIRYFLGPVGLDAAFDFPLMWALREAIATGPGGFAEVEAVLAREDVAFAGSGTVVPRMLGNHDTTRFLSAAAGDDGADAWSAPPPQPTTPEAYARTKLGLVALLTQPGMPVLYYGDEVALAGAGDPDSRRVWPAENALSPAQTSVRALARRLGTLRACSPDLRAAERTPLFASADGWGYARGDVVVLLATKSGAPSIAAKAGSYVDVLSGDSFVLPGPVAMSALSARVLVRADDPCR